LNDPIVVDARFEKDGSIRPNAFAWKGLHYKIDSVGRQWEEQDIRHILVMVNGDKVFELSFTPSTLCWHLIRIPDDFGSHQAV
jgi:hypothetical protein